MSYPVGSRVGAICSATSELVRMFGYGVYVGDDLPPPAVIGPFDSRLAELGITNPKIQLDNGDAVFGCECWWGPEEKVKAMIGERPVEIVTVAEYRAGNSAELPDSEKE